MSNGLLDDVARARDEALAAIAAAHTPAALADARVQALGQKAPLSQLKKGMAAVPSEDKPAVGRALNEAFTAVEDALARAQSQIETEALAEELARDRVDVTLPGRNAAVGHPHPISLMLERITDVFVAMGYRVAEGPEVETDYYNFEALNMPPDHPARSLWDTLYIAGAPTLLRTHTSPVQIRAMHAQPPPIYVIAPGRSFRRDAFDATHSPMFHQVEGLAVDRGITFADLKGTLDTFAHEVFGRRLTTRFRPSYFPFTEPSAEMDVSCPNCEGAGCPTCKRSGWIELLGCGMVHPNVLKAGGYDPEQVSGFAFGMGV
ncbi:MAG: phenylalanine--tRNA ligase subunit alpha, partial [Actinobacteria bacterium]